MDPLERKCPYTKDCENERIRACYENYDACTIYKKKEIVNQRIGTTHIKVISRIERIVG